MSIPSAYSNNPERHRASNSIKAIESDKAEANLELTVDLIQLFTQENPQSYLRATHECDTCQSVNQYVPEEIQNGVVRFISRNQRDLTKRFPELQVIAKSIKASSAILDGEIVAVDANGAQCFEQLQNHKRDCFIIYFAFDLLFLDGKSLTEMALIQRKAQLKRILPKSMTGRLRFTDHVILRGSDLFVALEAQQLERMVAKRVDSHYFSGRSKDWLKVKTVAGREEMTKRIESWGHG